MPALVRMRVSSTMPPKLRQSLSYRTRMLVADDGDEFVVSPGDARFLQKTKYAEAMVADAGSEPKRRGRPPKATPDEPVVIQPMPVPASAPATEAPIGIAAMTVPELRNLAEKRGHELPAHYLRRDELIEILGDDAS